MATFKQWEKNIENIKEISLEEAKELYKKYEKSQNEEEKIVLRNQIIEGLLPYTIKNISNKYKNYSVFKLLNEEDLISQSINYLVTCIETGKLLNIDELGDLFQGKYYSHIFNENYNTSQSLDNNPQIRPIITNDDFVKYFKLYIDLRNEKEITIDEFKQEIFKDKNNISKFNETEVKGIDNEHFKEVYEGFEKLYKKLEDKETYKVNLSENEIRFSKNFLYETMMKERINEESKEIDNMLDEVELTNLVTKIEKNMDEVLTEDQAKVIRLRFGLDGKGPKTLEETASIMNTKGEIVRQIEMKALRKLRNTEEIQEMKKTAY